MLDIIVSQMLTSVKATLVSTTELALTESMHSTAVARLDFQAIDVKLVSILLSYLPYNDLVRLRRAEMSTPIHHFKNFKENRYNLWDQ